MNKQRLSNLMLMSIFICNLFYSASYPYIYATTIKAVSKGYISFEQIATCIGMIIFNTLWNKKGDKIFRYYDKIIVIEIIADTILFAHVLTTGNLKFYFVFNIIIYAVITRCMCCGGVKMRALIHPDDKTREKYDNNSSTINAISTLLGVTISTVFNFDINTLFVFALIGNMFDNILFYYIFKKIKLGGKVNDEL